MPEKLVEIPFSNQAGSSAVKQNSREVLINLFAEVETSGRRQLNRRQRMCLSLLEELSGEKRAIEIAPDGTIYLVVANKAYSYASSTVTEIGTLSTSTGGCTIVFDDNGDVAFSDGATLYHWTGSTWSTPTTQSTVGTLTFLAGYAVYNEPGAGAGRFWWSNTNDMQTWGALDFATAEGKPDNLLRVWEDHNELWLFGAETIEIWPLSGGDPPFVRSASMDRGLGAALGVISEDNSVFWLGNDFIVYRADGYRPLRVSNHTIERMISDLTDAQKADCRAFTYSDQGHKFVTFVFPGALTVQYNVATGFWNVAKTYERSDWNVLGSQFTQTDIVLTGEGISQLSRGLNKDNGEVVERGGISAPIAAGARRVIMHSFFLDCEVGRAGEGVAPEIMLRVARDGETFGNETWRDAGTGETGEYGVRPTWRNLGMGRKMMVEIMTTDDFEFSILGADANVQVL